MRELFTTAADYIDNYYDNWESEYADKHVTIARSIVKKWLNIINSDCVTQEDVDSIVEKIISYNTMAGSMFSVLSEEFRLWAEAEGFKVLSKKKLLEHFKIVTEDFVRKFRADNHK